MAGLQVSVQRDIITDDWQRNWQESIAVRICALVLWVIVPLTLLAMFIALNNIKHDLKKIYIDKTDLLAYRVGKQLSGQSLTLSKHQIDNIHNIAHELGFSAIKLKLNENAIVIGNLETELDTVAQTIVLNNIILNNDNNDNSVNSLRLTAYHPTIEILIQEKRKIVLFPVIIILLSFAIFLIWTIRNVVNKPLQELINATRAVLFGNQNVKFEMSRRDEFGYLSRFFNDMLNELTQKQQELEYAVMEANTANETKSIFLANMSHELRTPLNAIIGYTEILVEDAEELKSLDSIPDLQKVQVAGRHLLDLINNILDISKIEAGKVEIYYEKVNLQIIIEEISSTIYPLMEKSGNTLKINIENDINYIVTDISKLRQVLLNLLGNACKFAQNGLITVNVKRKHSGATDNVIISVSDTGVGIPDEHLKTLFMAFKQGDDSVKSEYKGTGLGLAISRYYCNMLGGEISVKTKVDKGSTFYIHLPINNPTANQQIHAIEELVRSDG